MAKLISPGRSAALPPPTSDVTDDVWCGARSGGRVTSPPDGRRSPPAEWMRVVSNLAINTIYNLLRTSAPAESDEAVRQGINAGTFKSPHLKLAHLSPRVSEALKIAGVDMFLDFQPDLDSAVAAF